MSADPSIKVLHVGTNDMRFISPEHLARARTFAQRYTASLGNLKANKIRKTAQAGTKMIPLFAIFCPEDADLFITGLGKDRIHGMQIVGDARMAKGEVLLMDRLPAPPEPAEAEVSGDVIFVNANGVRVVTHG